MSTIPELFDIANSHNPELVFMVSHDKIKWKIQDMYKISTAIAKYLINLDVNTVTIFTRNIPESICIMLGSMMMNSRVCFLCHNSSIIASEYIINQLQSQIIFVDTIERLNMALKIKKTSKYLKNIVMIGDNDWNDIKKKNINSATNFMKSSSNDCCEIIYTSGTSGYPKGVMISHDNLLFSANAHIQNNKILISKPMRFISHLPLSHIGALMNDVIVPLVCIATYRNKSCVYFIKGHSLTIRDLQISRPTMLFCVPRLWEKIAEEAKKIERKSNGCIHHLMKKFCLLSHNNRQEGGSIYLKMIDILARKYMCKCVLNKLGLDKLMLPLTGGAYTNIKTLKYFGGIGLDILGAYGMTELMGVQAVSRPNSFIDEYSGLPVYGTEVRVVKETGELCFRGRQVALGYYGVNKSCIDDDGWFHTGDIGEIHKTGHIRITGRLDNLIITSTGYKIVPEPIEASICNNSVHIENIILIGHCEKFISALLCLKINGDISQALKEIQFYNEYLSKSKTEKIQKFILITLKPEDFTVTKKIIRDKIIKRYKNKIKAMYL